FHIHRESWPVPFIFKKIKSRGKVEDSEMYRTFNMGIGLAVVLPAAQAKRLVTYLAKNKVKSYIIGEVIKNSKKKVIL
ncbi:MAG: phosphoribosylformylglycinamidine cyclo-ligase, partial [Candidatus Omnitrophota bacterium]